MRQRIWSQTVEQVSEDTSQLRVVHPAKGEYVHLFSPRHTEVVQQGNWYHNLYARTGSYGYGATPTRLHWLVMGLSPGRGTEINVDHINRNRLDSRDENLRLIPRRTNQHNRVDNYENHCIHITPNNTYRVFVKFEGQHVYVPSFKTVDYARRCRDEYLKIAQEISVGVRTAPTKDELRSLSIEVGE